MPSQAGGPSDPGPCGGIYRQDAAHHDAVLGTYWVEPGATEDLDPLAENDL